MMPVQGHHCSRTGTVIDVADAVLVVAARIVVATMEMMVSNWKGIALEL